MSAHYEELEQRVVRLEDRDVWARVYQLEQVVMQLVAIMEPQARQTTCRPAPAGAGGIYLVKGGGS